MSIQKVNFIQNTVQQPKTTNRRAFQTSTRPYENDSVSFSKNNVSKSVKTQAAALLLAATTLLGASGCSAQEIAENGYLCCPPIASDSMISSIEEDGTKITEYYKDGQLVCKETEGYVDYGKLSSGRNVILYEKTTEEYENGQLKKSTKLVGEDKENFVSKYVDIYNNGELSESHTYYKQNDGTWTEVFICNE